MIVLDTNVTSEIMKPPQLRSAQVAAWVESCGPTDVFTSTVSLGEVLAGIAMLPLGKRKIALREAADKMFSTVFPMRILPFDEAAALAFAEIMAAKRRMDRTILALDAQIAGIAKSRGMAVATRNVVDFEGYGVAIVNPWSVRG